MLYNDPPPTQICNRTKCVIDTTRYNGASRYNELQQNIKKSITGNFLSFIFLQVQDIYTVPVRYILENKKQNFDFGILN